MDTNIIYNIDCVTGMNQMIDEESIDLIIADPPYFKVIGEKWDYLWRTEEDYLEWSEKWIAEAARVLRMGGSFYLFGYFRMLSRLLPILEKYGFELRQQIGTMNAGEEGSHAEYPRASNVLRIPPLGKLDASGSCCTSNLPVNSSIMPPLPSCSTKASCFSAVPSVSG